MQYSIKVSGTRSDFFEEIREYIDEFELESIVPKKEFWINWTALIFENANIRHS